MSGGRYAGRQRRQRASQAGFTMIEVLIAVGLLAGMSILVWTSVSSMFQARDIFTKRAERDLIVRNAMSRITNEIAAAYMAGPENGGEQLPGEALDPAQLTEEMKQRSTQEAFQFGFIGKDDRLDFTSFAHVRTRDDEPAGHHAEIGYEIRSQRGDDGRLVRQLVRREDTTLDADITRGGKSFVLLPELSKLKLSYWDAGAVQVGSVKEVAQGRWVSDWDTTRRDYAGRLPTRVRVEVWLPPVFGTGDDEVYITQVQIGATEVLEF
jgi:general secretion pathway protein J